MNKDERKKYAFQKTNSEVVDSFKHYYEDLIEALKLLLGPLVFLFILLKPIILILVYPFRYAYTYNKIVDKKSYKEDRDE